MPPAPPPLPARGPGGVPLPDGIVAVVKRDCPTCALVASVLAEVAAAGVALTIYSQDDPTFPEGLAVIDDTSLSVSADLDLTTVPTLIRVEGGVEIERIEGWSRPQWESFSGLSPLGAGLPEHRPGCGSLTADPVVAERIAARRADLGGPATRLPGLASRRVELAALEDDLEACFVRGWTDGLPVVPPTPERVLRMLTGTSRRADEVVAVVPPDMVEATVEKVGINAVMAGCRPEYLPVVLTAVEAACSDEFNIHGLLCTTWFAGPVLIVNGPWSRTIHMNSGVNCLGPGNRANATIGRALALVVRNVGGGRPGEIDQATLGTPGKYTFCFAEDESSSPWEPLSVARGFAPGTSTVTLFAGDGVRTMVDQQSREPASLTWSFAWTLEGIWHPKLAGYADALVVVSPEHARVFREAGWTRTRLQEELMARLSRSGDELVRGAGGCAEGMPASVRGHPIPKFAADGLLIVHAGGQAGLFSAVVGGWVRSSVGSQPVTREIRP